MRDCHSTHTASQGELGGALWLCRLQTAVSLLWEPEAQLAGSNAFASPLAAPPTPLPSAAGPECRPPLPVPGLFPGSRGGGWLRRAGPRLREYGIPPIGVSVSFSPRYSSAVPMSSSMMMAGVTDVCYIIFSSSSFPAVLPARDRLCYRESISATGGQQESSPSVCILESSGGAAAGIRRTKAEHDGDGPLQQQQQLLRRRVRRC
ncbi:hypothetical protein CSOJ01_04142 [Colletotrichum sojae]|uniref:Uncharacterized protein n=1 Tax=Colletotrichum sojae TaxID=2175907 RepID=A0A8H6JKA4_9PEZI|nr:hypothetical protein CSOJ01_04142 [Colletotrichum sojae]